MSITFPIAEWLEQHVGRQAVAGSIPGRNIYFHFIFVAFIPLLTAQRSLYKRNPAWQSSRVMDAKIYI